MSCQGVAEHAGVVPRGHIVRPFSRLTLLALIAATSPELTGCTDPAAHGLGDLDANIKVLRRKYEDVEGDLIMLTPRLAALEEVDKAASEALEGFKKDIVAPFMAGERRELVRLDKAVASLANDGGQGIVGSKAQEPKREPDVIGF